MVRPEATAGLYIDGEMPQELLLQERAKAMIAPSACQPPHPEFFRLLSMDRQELGVSLNLALPEHQAAVEAHLEPVDLLIIDNLSTLVNSGRENDAESWNEMQAWLLRLRRMGKTVLLIHHSGRGGNARGTSKREDVLDTVIQLKHPDDYEPEDGARFEVNLTKARGIYGDDALPFEAKLGVIDGRNRWTFSLLQDNVLDQIEELSPQEGQSGRSPTSSASASPRSTDYRQHCARRVGYDGQKMSCPTVPRSREWDTWDKRRLRQADQHGTSGTDGTSGTL
jgi:putative DNA primase/helicase